MPRFKSYYNSQPALAHAWANGLLSPHGSEFRSTHMFATHERIYSYGKHFCIAYKLTPTTVLVTDKFYSHSTQRHVHLVRNALNPQGFVDQNGKQCEKGGWFEGCRWGDIAGKAVCEVIKVPSLDVNSTPEEWVSQLEVEAADLLKKAKKARENKFRRLNDAVNTLNRIVTLSKKFDLPLPTPSELSNQIANTFVVEVFKAKCNSVEIHVPFETLHPCYLADNQPDQAVAA